MAEAVSCQRGREGEPGRRYRTAIFAVGAVLVLSSVALLHASHPVVSVVEPSSALAERFLICRTEYEEATGRTLAPELTYGPIVQVHKLTKLSLSTGEAGRWRVDGALVGDKHAKEVEVLFTTVGASKVEVEHAQGKETFTVYAKIIRRELRDLTDTDREAYFEAVHELVTIGQEEGVRLYGSTFQSGDELLRIHLFGAADRSCDHWHDDAGMLNHHVAVTWKFEQSLRLINAATASHYWDYTREVAQGIEWYDSELFRDDWFGPASPSNKDHIIDTGRWAYTRILGDAREYSSITNPYGLLRSPWNTNPTPYLMRFNTTFGSVADGWTAFPSCSDFASVIGDDLADLMPQYNGFLHGPVHIMLGGHWGMGAELEAVGASLDGGASELLLVSKFLWRQGVARVPELCSSDTPAEECSVTCPADILGEDTTVETLFEKYGVDKVSSHVATFNKLAKNAGLSDADVIRALCDFWYPGEMFTSAAPQDPIFWPVHGMMERHLQLLRLLKYRGELDFDETWGYSHSFAPSDTHVVCDWSQTEDNAGMPTCILGETCEGHRARDLIPFLGLFEDQESEYTNLEFYSVISPLNKEMPYTYDSLDYWPGCVGSSLLAQAQLTSPPTRSKSV